MNECTKIGNFSILPLTNYLDKLVAQCTRDTVEANSKIPNFELTSQIKVFFDKE